MKLYRLFEKKVFKIQPDLERIRKALKDIGDPHLNFRSVLISGTNGKGSTAAFLESILREHRLKTGMFTSPHIIDENERWQINRKSITDERLDDYISQLKPIIKKYDLTYFEASTLIAFRYCSDEKVNVAVLEFGLGGRWDSTNVVYPEVSIITNVSLDHTDLLGNTLDKIAYEKLGISRKDRPLVIGQDQIEIISQAVMKGIREIYHYPIGFTYQIKNNKMIYSFKNYKIEDIKPSLLGKRQFSNCAAAITGFLVFAERNSIKVDKEKIKNAVSKTFLPARMQILSEDPLIVLDGAHNEDAVIKTFKEIEELFPTRKIITIYGGRKDKNWKKILGIITYRSKEVICTQIPVSRSLKKSDLPADLKFCEEIKQAVDTAKSIYTSDSLILITGSLYLSGEMLKIFANRS